MDKDLVKADRLITLRAALKPSTAFPYPNRLHEFRYTATRGTVARQSQRRRLLPEFHFGRGCFILWGFRV